MKVTLESTTKIVELNGIQCRVWQGETARGVPCHAYIPLIGADKDFDTSEFDADLQERVAPRPDLDVIPLRLLL